MSPLLLSQLQRARLYKLGDRGSIALTEELVRTGFIVVCLYCAVTDMRWIGGEERTLVEGM